MEDPDNSAQKPVATAGSRKSGVLKLPLANRCGPDKQRYPNDESNKNLRNPDPDGKASGMHSIFRS